MGITNKQRGTQLFSRVEFTDGSAQTGAPLIHQATKVLTNAQIKALPTTAIVIVASPGPETIIFPTLMFVRANHWPANYTNLTGTTGFFLNNSQISNPIDSGDLFGLGDPSDSVTAFSLLYQTSDGSTVQAIAGDYDSDIKGKDLRLSSNNVGDFTGGDSSNTLTVTVAYMIYNATTGTFE